MKKVGYYTITILLAVGTVSCSSLRYVEYDIIRPPQVLLSDRDPIAIVYNIKNTESQDDETAPLPADTVRSKLFGLMMTSIQNSVYTQPVEAYMMDKPTGEPIDEEQAENLIEYFGQKSIITLNNLSMRTELHADTLDSDWYISLRSHVAEANISVRMSDAKEPMTFTVTDTFVWQGSGYALSDAINSLPPQRETMDEAIAGLNYKISEIYLPYIEQVGRIYFVSIYPLMRKADRYWKEEKYDEASYLWEYIFENTTNKALQGKAAANMAIYEELNDRYESAIMWARMAFALFCKRSNLYDSHIAYISDYIHQLKIRVKEKNMLDRNNEYITPVH